MPGIYIHIPFCKQSCNYCDFHFSTLLKNKNDFLKALLKEIELQKEYFTQLQASNSKPQTISSVYFGGGTPSLFSEKEINRIFMQLSKYFNINTDAEITFESN
ncbi:MAG: radical SAM protein, partial [Bacteroidota bacterium]